MTKKASKNSKSISTKDQKILWAKAAGRCSICKVELTLDTSSNSVTLGEMCHIVGEKNNEQSPRGISKLNSEERNSYSNLILLCAHHHREIDKNYEKYTIEFLHSIKGKHEIWVTESLSAKEIDPDELVYSELIDLLSTKLQLDNWDWFISHAVRNLIDQEFIFASDIIVERYLATIFPTTKPKLKKCIEELMLSFENYIKHYLTFASINGSQREYYSPDNSYKSIYPNPKYHYFTEKKALWERKNFILLCYYVVKVNEFASTVRQEINPLFYRVKGRFLIIDEFGLHLGQGGALLFPKLEIVEERLNEINREIKKFEEISKE